MEKNNNDLSTVEQRKESREKTNPEFICPKWINILLIIFATALFVSAFIDIIKVSDNYVSYFSLVNLKNSIALIKLSGIILLVVCAWDVLDSSLLLFNFKWTRTVYTKISKGVRLGTGILNVVLIILQLAFYYKNFWIASIVFGVFAITILVLKIINYVHTCEDTMAFRQLREEKKLKKQQLLEEKAQKKLKRKQLLEEKAQEKLKKQQLKLERKEAKALCYKQANDKPYNRKKNYAVISAILIPLVIFLFFLVAFDFRFNFENLRLILLSDYENKTLNYIAGVYIAILIALLIISIILMLKNKNTTDFKLKKVGYVFYVILLVFNLFYTMLIVMQFKNSYSYVYLTILIILYHILAYTLCIVGMISYKKSKKQLFPKN